jgi:hypothetical protein
MMPETLSCPYCNSLVLLPRLPGPDQKIRCPRCQEAFLYLGEGRVAAGGAGSEAITAAFDPSSRGSTQTLAGRIKNRRMAQIILAVMAVMAGVAFLFAWYTTPERRRNDHRAGAGPVVALAPAQLHGLGYLPADCNWITGIHLGELMDGPDTRPLVEHVLRERGALEDFEKRVGVPLKNIHHIVLGVRISSLRIVAVVHTREPYEISEVKSARGLNAKKAAPQGKRTLYRYPLMGSQLGGYFWPADDQTLVFALSDRDFQDVPETAGSPVERFAPSLQEVLSKKLSVGTPLWTAAYHDDWSSLPGQVTTLAKLAQAFGAGAIPAIEPSSKEDKAALAELRTLAAWLHIENNTTIHLAAQGRDDEGAKELDAYLAAQGLEAGMLLKSPSGRDDAKPLGKVVSRQRDGDWVQADATTSLEDIVRSVSSRPRPVRGGGRTAQ